MNRLCNTLPCVYLSGGCRRKDDDDDDDVRHTKGLDTDAEMRMTL